MLLIDLRMIYDMDEYSRKLVCLEYACNKP